VKAPQTSPVPIEADPLYDALMALGFNPVGVFADSAYLLPSRSWVESTFAKSWFDFKASLGPWTAEDNDCDDFARGAAFLAELLHHNTKDRPAKTSLAFGEFWYIRHEDNGGHAINFYAYREEGVIKVGFFEPQTCLPVTLTEKEISSCVHFRL
jgi:hypothetical protein